MRSVAVVLALLSLTACESSAATLVVELRSDLRPGDDFVGVRVLLDGREVDRRPGTRGDDYVAGVRLAEIGDITADRARVEVELLDPDGAPIASDRVVVSVVAGLQVVRMIVATDCLGVVCEDGLKCMGGGCVPDECQATDDGCAPIVCEADGDCMRDVPDCVAPVCADVACLWAVRDERCTGGGRCDPRRGCVGGADPDGGVDAGAGGGVDAGAPGDAGCATRADCPADVPGAWGACRSSTLACDSGTETRSVERFDCVGGACVMSRDSETRACAPVANGRPCTSVASDRDCSVCMGGACVLRDGGEDCDFGAAIRGGCRGGRCCTGCWDGTSCGPPDGSSDTQCGMRGEPCVDCTAAGETCGPVFGGGGSCR